MEAQTQGNVPENENIVTRKMSVAGRTVDVMFNKDDLETPIGSKEPDGLEGAELEQWRDKAGNEFKAMKVSNDKYAEAAKLKREIEDLRAKFEQDKKEWEAKKSEYTPPVQKQVSEAPDFYKVLSEMSGETINDVESEMDFEEDNKKLYLKAKHKYEKMKDDYILSQTRTSNPQEIIEKSLLRDKITRDGNDYVAVEAFAKLRGWNVDSYSYDAFKNANPKQERETEKINKYVQPTEFIWVGSGNKISTAGVKKLEDSFETPEELTEYIDAEMAKENPDPRVLEFLRDK